MINIREGSFETNSSSTHCIVVVEDSQLEKWKNGELFYIADTSEFVSKYEREKYEKNLMGRLVMEYADYSQEYQNEIAEAIKEGKLKEYVQDMIDDGIWDIDRYEKPMSFGEWCDWMEGRELEEDTTTYTTPNGEKLHIFCHFGYDG